MKLSGRSARRLTAVSIAVAAVFSTSPAWAAHAASPGTTATSQADLTILAGAPRTVSGYSSHALDEMSRDNIGKYQVEDILYTTYSRAKKQKNGTWRYPLVDKIQVIANANGYIVTAWRRG